MIFRAIGAFLFLLCGYLVWVVFDQAVSLDHVRSSFEGSERDRRMLMNLANASLSSLPQVEARKLVSQYDWTDTFQIVECDVGERVWVESLADIDVASAQCSTPPRAYRD